MSKMYGSIYKITNKVDGKVYVGQTTVGFGKRYNNDLGKNTHNRHLKFAINKYGINNFIIEEEIDIAYSREELNKKEIQYIVENDCYLKGYNLTKGGEGITGLPKEMHPMYGVRRYGKANFFYGKHHNDATKLIISNYATTRIGALNPNYGNGDKIRGEKNPMYGVSPQERMDTETYNHWKEGISNASKGINNNKARKIINVTTGEIFDYIKLAIKVYGEIAISACCRGKVKTAGKCKWSYYDDYLNTLS